MFDIKSFIPWIVLFVLLYLLIGFFSYIVDVREDNRLDRKIRKEKENKLESR